MHRDVSEGNIMLGMNPKEPVGYIIDLDYAKIVEDFTRPATEKVNSVSKAISLWNHHSEGSPVTGSEPIKAAITVYPPSFSFFLC
jgi:hypothetical protein